MTLGDAYTCSAVELETVEETFYYILASLSSSRLHREVSFTALKGVMNFNIGRGN